MASTTNDHMSTVESDVVEGGSVETVILFKDGGALTATPTLPQHPETTNPPPPPQSQDYLEQLRLLCANSKRANVATVQPIAGAADTHHQFTGITSIASTLEPGQIHSSSDEMSTSDAAVAVPSSPDLSRHDHLEDIKVEMIEDAIISPVQPPSISSISKPMTHTMSGNALSLSQVNASHRSSETSVTPTATAATGGHSATAPIPFGMIPALSPTAMGKFPPVAPLFPIDPTAGLIAANVPFNPVAAANPFDFNAFLMYSAYMRDFASKTGQPIPGMPPMPTLQGMITPSPTPVPPSSFETVDLNDSLNAQFAKEREEWETREAQLVGQLELYKSRGERKYAQLASDFAAFKEAAERKSDQLLKLIQEFAKSAAPLRKTAVDLIDLLTKLEDGGKMVSASLVGQQATLPPVAPSMPTPAMSPVITAIAAAPQKEVLHVSASATGGVIVTKSKLVDGDKSMLSSVKEGELAASEFLDKIAQDTNELAMPMVPVNGPESKYITSSSSSTHESQMVTVKSSTTESAVRALGGSAYRLSSRASEVCFGFSRGICKTPDCKRPHICSFCESEDHCLLFCRQRPSICTYYNSIGVHHDRDCSRKNCQDLHICLYCQGNHSIKSCMFERDMELKVKGICFRWNSQNGNCHYDTTCSMRHVCLRCEGNHPARNCYMSTLALFQANEVRGPRICLSFNHRDGEGCKVKQCSDVHVCLGCGSEQHHLGQCREDRTISMNFQSRPSALVDRTFFKCCLHCLGTHGLIQCMMFMKRPFLFCYYFNAARECDNRSCDKPHICSWCEGRHPILYCPDRAASILKLVTSNSRSYVGAGEFRSLPPTPYVPSKASTSSAGGSVYSHSRDPSPYPGRGDVMKRDAGSLGTEGFGGTGHSECSDAVYKRSRADV